MTTEKVRKDGAKEALILKKMSDELKNTWGDRLRGQTGRGER